VSVQHGAFYYNEKMMTLRSHSYLFTGDIDKAQQRALGLAAEILGIQTQKLGAHPDFIILEKSPLAIQDARHIRERSSKKSFSGRGRVLLIRADILTREACSALLKTLEEPAGLSYFLLVTNSKDNIPATLRSRMTVVEFKKEKSLPKEQQKLIEEFLKSAIPQRQTMVNSFMQDKEKTLDFLSGLEVILEQHLLADLKGKAALAEEILEKKNLLFSRGSSPKMILEHICFVLPRL
jgi:hypothetical protein